MAAYPIPPLNAVAPPGVIGKPAFLAPLYAGLKDQWDQLSRVSHVLRLAMRGKINALGERTFTLTANAATSTLTDERLTSDGVVIYDPMTVNAVTALVTAADRPYSLSGDRNNGVWTVRHANNAQTDRDFRILMIG